MTKKRTENVDITGQEEQVLQKASKHVPRLKVHERADKVETVCGSQGYNDIQQHRSGLDELGEVFPSSNRMWDSVINGVRCTVKRNDIAQSKENYSDCIYPFRALDRDLMR